MKFGVFLIAAAFILAIFALFEYLSFYKQDSPSVSFEGKVFLVEIADNDFKRERGLMNREKLCSSCGMFFIFEEEMPLTFWMKNTQIPLDIVFIDKNFKIVNISKAFPCLREPCKVYSSVSPAMYVLEVNLGNFNKSDIGKKIEFAP